jgi:membrane protein implicated in regulation of membrane protease activity
MGIGISVFLIAVGAILAFATNVSVSGLDLNVVGVILLIVGVVGLATTLLIFAPRRRMSRVERRVTDSPYADRRVVDRRPVADDRSVVEERRAYDYDDPTL